MRTRSCSPRVGFTLTELLVVMAIIVLLVAVTLPGLTGLANRTDPIVCARNLRQLGQTSALQERDGIGQPARFTVAENWVGEVLKDTDGQTAVFNCPAGGQQFTTVSEGDPDAGGAGGNADAAMRDFLQNYRYRVGCFTWLFWTNPDGSRQSAQQRWGFSTPWQYFPIDGSYFVRRLSQTKHDTGHLDPFLDQYGNQVMYIGVYNQFAIMQQWDTFEISNGSPRVADAAVGCLVMQYEEDSNPYRYWMYNEAMIIPPDSNIDLATSDTRGAGSAWGYSGQKPTYRSLGSTRAGEDRWYTWEAGGYNWPESSNNDSTFRITHNDNGVTEVAIRRNSRNYAYSTDEGFNGYLPALVKPAGVPSADEILVQYDQGASFWGNADPETYEKVYIGEPTEGETPPPPPDETTYTVSYGINRHIVSGSDLGPDKILAIDYDHLVIYEENPEDVAEWSEATVPFARHSGKINVLFRGGNVKAMSPESIDPTVPSLNAKYWLP